MQWIPETGNQQLNRALIQDVCPAQTQVAACLCTPVERESTPITPELHQKLMEPPSERPETHKNRRPGREHRRHEAFAIP